MACHTFASLVSSLTHPMGFIRRTMIVLLLYVALTSKQLWSLLVDLCINVVTWVVSIGYRIGGVTVGLTLAGKVDYIRGYIDTN